MQSDPNNPATLNELRRLLPCLRQALGCYVCYRLLKDPMGPNHNVCRHSVCRNCQGGKMGLKPACSWCKDHWEFVPNPLLKTLVTCFKKLCLYIFNSHLGHVIQNSCINGETNHLIQILREGMDFQDDYSYNPPTSSGDITSNIASTASTSSFESTTEITSPASEPTIDVTTDHDQIEEQVLQNADFLSSNTDENEIETVPEVKVNIARNTYGRKRKTSGKIHDHNYGNKTKIKTMKKPVIFLKRAAVNKTKSKCSLSQISQKTHRTKKNKRKKLKKLGFRTFIGDAPSDLERIDKSVLSVKKGKTELHPPELKPLSSCNCGKSGNFNQLTCIGQRCPCYSMKLPCVGCKCKGCRNPKKGPDYQGMYNINSSAVLRSGTRNTTES